MIYSFLCIFVLNVFVSKNELFSDFFGELQFQGNLIRNLFQTSGVFSSFPH